MRIGGRHQRAIVVLLIVAVVLLLAPMIMLANNQSIDEAILQHRRIVSQSVNQPINQLSRYRIAWAIPVGGKTERLHRLKTILGDLIAGGAGRWNVFIMEDNGSRASTSQSDALATAARAWGVNHLQSNVRRGPEPPELFGLHLARHYHYMMDTLLLAPSDRLSLTSPPHTDIALGYDFVVILEDDLRLAPDAVKYFHSMASVMDADASLLCTCAHADNAFFATTRSEHELLRDHHHHHASEVVNSSLTLRPLKPVDRVDHLSSIFFGADGVEVIVVNEDDENKQHQGVSSLMSSSVSDGSSPFVSLAASEFDFRRGQHFMAPGWMTSSAIYKRIRPDWFDAELNLPHKERLNMPNGNWDAFMDAQAFHRKLECIYPEIPRIAHQGANGYTVSASMQAELFDNLRLSTLPATIDYGSLTRLELHHYDASVLSYIASCTRVTSLPELSLYRRSKLCLMLPSASDKDPLFAELFSGYFGVVSIGGHAHYGKQRGIHHGAVFTRWLTNLILVIGAHGDLAKPFFALHSQPGEQQLLTSLRNEASAKLSRKSLREMYVGCYADNKSRRVLPYQLGSVNPVRPLACLTACQLHGFTHSGVEWGWECWCGTADTVVDDRKVADSRCDSGCVATWEDKMRDATAVTDGKYKSVDEACGGDLTISVITSSTSLQPEAQQSKTKSVDWPHLKASPLPATRLSNAKADVEVLAAAAGLNCDDACAAAVPSMECDDALLALIHSDCTTLKELMGCSTCESPTSPWDGFAAPGQRAQAGNCVTSRGKYLRCNAVSPDAEYRRACVCLKPN